MFRRLLIATVVGILAAFAVAGFRHAMLLLEWLGGVACSRLIRRECEVPVAWNRALSESICNGGSL